MQLKNKTLRTINAGRARVGIVVSRFNDDITGKLLDAALTAASVQGGVKQKNVAVISVAGAMEIPYALQQLARAKGSKKYDCLVALGAVIRGDTPHFDYVCAMAQQGALRVSLDYNIPIGFGVITVNTEKQAQSRIHVAAEAVVAALELATIKI